MKGLPSNPEWHLRRLLAEAVLGVNGYYDDGEAQGCEFDISIDFMRDAPEIIEEKIILLRKARREA